MKLIDRGVIYDPDNQKPDRRFCQSPTLVQLADGRLVVGFRAGSSKDAADENIIFCISSDGGCTWEIVFDKEFDPLLDGVRYGWRGARLIEVNQGHLLGAFSLFDRSVPGRPLSNPATTGTLPGRIVLADSFDAGRTWKNLRPVDVTPFTGIAITGPMLRLRDGSIALVYESWKDYDDPAPGRHRVIWRISHDEGKSWGPNIAFAHDPNGKRFYWDSRHAVDPVTGKVVGAYWTYDGKAEKDLTIHVNWSISDGQSWSDPVDSGIHGQIASPLVLPDRRVLLTYVHRHEPGSLRAVLSEDFGRTWQMEDELVFYESLAGGESGMDRQREFSEYWEDMYRWTFGHPTPLLLADGDVLIVYYGGSPKAMGVHWVRCRP